MTDKTYRCLSCDQVKSYSEFHKKGNSKLGIKKRCKECLKVAAKAYRAEHSRHIKEKRNINRKELSDLGEAYLHKAVTAAIHRAKRKGYSNYDTHETLVNHLIDIGGVPDRCPILGVPLEYGGGSNANSPSLDRVDVTKGYQVGNIWFISAKANMMKNSATFPELIRFCKYFVDNFNNKGRNKG